MSLGIIDFDEKIDPLLTVNVCKHTTCEEVWEKVCSYHKATKSEMLATIGGIEMPEDRLLHWEDTPDHMKAMVYMKGMWCAWHESKNEDKSKWEFTNEKVMCAMLDKLPGMTDLNINDPNLNVSEWASAHKVFGATPHDLCQGQAVMSYTFRKKLEQVGDDVHMTFHIQKMQHHRLPGYFTTQNWIPLKTIMCNDKKGFEEKLADWLSYTTPKGRQVKKQMVIDQIMADNQSWFKLSRDNRTREQIEAEYDELHKDDSAETRRPMRHTMAMVATGLPSTGSDS